MKFRASVAVVFFIFTGTSCSVLNDTAQPRIPEQQPSSNSNQVEIPAVSSAASGKVEKTGPQGSVFAPSATDIKDPGSFYRRDGYENIDVVRMQVITRTGPGACTPGDQSGCTLTDVLEDTDPGDDFKVGIDVKLITDDLPETGKRVNATLRQRGASARLASQKSFRIRLKDGLWRSEERIKLNKHPDDQSRMSNKLAMDLMQDLPYLPSLRTQFVNLEIDNGDGGVDFGLYTHVESPAKEYLINRRSNKDDNLYKARFFTFSPSDLSAIEVNELGEPVDQRRFDRRIEIERGTDHSKLVEMVAAINNPDISFQTVLDRYFNANNVLMWVTANLLLGQVDDGNQNFYLHNPKGSETFYFLPWDYDGALQVQKTLTDGNAVEELRRRRVYGYADAANNQFLRQYYLLPGAHERIVRAAVEVRRQYFSDARIKELSTRYANVIRPFISNSPDVDNRGGIPRLRFLRDWEARWQSFPSVVAGNLARLSASPNMPLPHRLNLPFSRDGKTVLWWERATDISGGDVTYDLEVASQPNFSEGSIAFRSSRIANEPVVVEFELDRDSLAAGTWYYRVKARSGSFYQWANNQENEGGKRYPGVRKFSVR